MTGWIGAGILGALLIIPAGVPMVLILSNLPDPDEDEETGPRMNVIERRHPEVPMTGCGGSPRLHSDTNCAHAESWEVEVDRGGFLYVQYGITARSEGGVAFAVGPHGMDLLRRNVSGKTLLEPGEKSLMIIMYEDAGAQLGASVRSNAPIEVSTVQTGDVTRVTLDPYHVEPLTRDGDADWERVTLRGSAALEEPFFGQVLLRSGGVAERFVATNDAGEERSFGPHTNPGYWVDDEGRSWRVASFTGPPGDWTFEMAIAQPRGTTTSVSVGLVMDPAFFNEANTTELPRFETFSLDSMQTYGPGAGFQERLPYRPDHEVLLASPHWR